MSFVLSRARALVSDTRFGSDDYLMQWLQVGLQYRYNIAGQAQSATCTLERSEETAT